MKHVSWSVSILAACAALTLAGPAYASSASSVEWLAKPLPHGVCSCTDPLIPRCASCDDGGTDAGGEEEPPDAGVEDAGMDAGIEDAGMDAGQPDAGPDAGPVDSGVADAGTDAGTHEIQYVGGGCACGGGTSAALMFGVLGAALFSVRRRASRR